MSTRRPAVQVSTGEVARLAGVTIRQLQTWSAAGLVTTDTRPGYGHRRRWTPSSIRHVAIMGQLVNTLGVAPGIASALATEAVLDAGEMWSAAVGEDITVVGRTPWIPTPPDEDGQP